MVDIEKVVIITQPTWLDGLIEKYNSKEQAKFYINHNGGDFKTYLDQHNVYYDALKRLKRSIPRKLRFQVVEKSFLPSFLFGPKDLVIVMGRDGLVINTAKYLVDQPILGVNPDPSRVDGILLKFNVDEVSEQISKILDDDAEIGNITLVKAELNDGQIIIGVNDIFIGYKTHKSARYTLRVNERSEQQSSSGIIISTGIGSTGWIKSIIASSLSISNEVANTDVDQDREFNFKWDSNYLVYAVREAWKSSSTGNLLSFGRIIEGDYLEVVSHMPTGGVIFSDGMEEDHIQFNSGRSVKISIPKRKIKYYPNDIE